MYEMIDFSQSMPNEWRQKFFDKTWEYRDCFGQDFQSISGGVKHFAVHIGRNSTPLKAAKARNASKMSFSVSGFLPFFSSIFITSGKSQVLLSRTSPSPLQLSK